MHTDMNDDRALSNYLCREVRHEPVGFGLGDKVRYLRPVLAHDHLERGLMLGHHGSEYAVLTHNLLQLPALGAYRVDQFLVGQASFFHVVELGQVIGVLDMGDDDNTTNNMGTDKRVSGYY